MKNIPFKSIVQHIKNIAERNKVFNALGPEQQRKEIAYEGLLTLITTGLTASTGNYWNSTLFSSTKDLSATELQSYLLNSNFEDCRVCQRGLMMLAQIKLGNEISGENHCRENGNSEIVKGFDYSNEFKEMENEYEHNQYGLPYQTNTSKKMANICCNIIANGNFNRFDNTDYLTLWNINLKQ